MYVTGVTIYHKKLDKVFNLHLMREVNKEGKVISENWHMDCPDCGQQYAKIDSDMFTGRVSMVCTGEGCKFHETINFQKIIKEDL